MGDVEDLESGGVVGHVGITPVGGEGDAEGIATGVEATDAGRA